MNQKEVIVALSSTSKLIPRDIFEFLKLNSKVKEFNLSSPLKYPLKKKEEFKNLLKDNHSFKIVSQCRRKAIKIITFCEKSYPERLRNLPDPAAVLYGRGNFNILAEDMTVGIVGSRKASERGLKITRQLSRELAERGICIISGLALGIDAEAHRGALEAGGKTIAVLGSAIDQIYPSYNSGLAQRILSDNGLILSEYPPSYPLFKYNFPLRNRIIAGLSDVLVITEAAERSGALITAHLAAEYGKDVFAVPGEVDRLSARGTNSLIKEGAYCFTETEDILHLFGISDKQKKYLRLSDEEKIVLGVIDAGAKDFDKIINASGFSAKDLNQLLLALELKGAVKKIGPGQFERN